MAESSVFIGLVSHGQSKFIKSQGANGLSSRLCEAFGQAGWKCTLQVNVRNLFDERPFTLTSKMARESVKAEINLERRWSVFLSKQDRFRQSFRILGRQIASLIRLKRNSDTREIRRLLNIESSHRDLYEQAILSGYEWTIILEDDAFAPDFADLVRGLLGIFSNEKDVKFLNLSASFSLESLGIGHILLDDRSETWGGPVTRHIFKSMKPATNTVCAIAYKTEFLAQVVADLNTQSQQPIIPIDWMLNRTLMRLWESGKIGAKECWFVEPAPIVQLSMIDSAAMNDIMHP